MYTYWYTALGNKTTNMNCVFKMNMISLIKVPNDPASQPISGFDMEKVTTTLKQFVRDWSDEVHNNQLSLYIFSSMSHFQYS